MEAKEEKADSFADLVRKYGHRTHAFTRTCFAVHLDKFPWAFPREQAELLKMFQCNLEEAWVQIEDDPVVYHHAFGFTDPSPKSLFPGKAMKSFMGNEDNQALEILCQVLDRTIIIDGWHTHQLCYPVIRGYLESEQRINKWRLKTRDVSCDVSFQKGGSWTPLQELLKANGLRTTKADQKTDLLRAITEVNKKAQNESLVVPIKSRKKHNKGQLEYFTLKMGWLTRQKRPCP